MLSHISKQFFILCTMKVNLALGSTTVWPKLHLLLCSSKAHLAILSWNTNTWSDTTPLHGKSFGSVITSNSFKYHRYFENVISYRRYCDDIAIAKIIVSEWVILHLTAITRSYSSNIQNGGGGGRIWERVTFHGWNVYKNCIGLRTWMQYTAKLLFEKCSKFAQNK